MGAVYTGASTFVINEDLCNQRGLIIEDTKTATLANGTDAKCQLTELVRMYCNNRDAICDETLLGVLSLEEMDLIVYPVNHKLVSAHWNTVVHLLR